MDTIQLDPKAQAVVKALVDNPPQPNDALKKALANHKRILKEI